MALFPCPSTRSDIVLGYLDTCTFHASVISDTQLLNQILFVNQFGQPWIVLNFMFTTNKTRIKDKGKLHGLNRLTLKSCSVHFVLEPQHWPRYYSTYARLAALDHGEFVYFIGLFQNTS